MADWESMAEATETAMQALEKEQQKLTELQQKMDADSTTVRAKDRSLSMTFDGRGELTGMQFHGTKFRSMAPGQLAHLIVETVQSGRAQAIEKLSAGMDLGLSGVSFADLASGKANPEQILESLMGPFAGELGGAFDEITGSRPKNKDK
ncbi:YbaB/EbfC family nucleoid-associated protein [Amycolatopsis pithecellobii]|nr:YbaB/EbfC family nucleoid-associated protein [Amycolatopsis pithecellobii]